MSLFNAICHQPYAVQFSPPLICFPEELPPCTKIIKHFTVSNLLFVLSTTCLNQMNNHSLCDVKIDWSPVTTAQVNITVEPNNNTIGKSPLIYRFGT